MANNIISRWIELGDSLDGNHYAAKLDRLVEAASAVIIQRQEGPVVGWNYDAIGVAALNELTAALKEIELKGEHGE